jgi:hypothetical protein
VAVIPTPPDELELRRRSREMRDVQSQIARLQARSVQLVAEMDELAVTDTMSTSGWLAWTAGLTTGEARRQMSLARRLPELPKLSEAFAHGTISEGVVAALVTVATPANEAALLATAEAATGPQLGKLVADYRRVKPTVSSRDGDETFFQSWFDHHGMYDGRLRAHPDQSAQLDAAIRSVLEADRDDTTGRDGIEPMSRLDALVALAEDHLAGRSSTSHVLPQRFQAIVRVDESVLHPDDRDDGDDDDRVVGDACLAGATSLDPATARRMVCDAGIAALVTRHGEPLTATAPQRFATPAQVVALHARDKTCQYPGCGRRARLIAHHVTPHPVGPTHLDNLASRESIPFRQDRLRGEVVVGQHVGIARDRTAKCSDMDDSVLDVDHLCHGTGGTRADDDEPPRRHQRRVGSSVEERPWQARIVDGVQVDREVESVCLGHWDHLPITRRVPGHDTGSRQREAGAAPA